MRRRLALAVLLLIFAGGASGASPSCVYACSCVQPPSLEVAVQEWGSAVFTGLAVSRTGETVEFAVERWYAGAGAARLIRVQTGNDASCGLDIQPGEQLFLTATQDGGRFHPSICSPYARMGTAEAQALVAEAEATFGPGQVLTGPGPADPGDSADWLPAVGVGVAVVLVGGLGIAALVLLRRRPA